MVIAYIMVGTLVGLVALVAVVAYGAPLWAAALLYSLAGGSAVILTAFARLMLGRTEVNNVQHPQTFDETSQSSAGPSHELLQGQSEGSDSAMKILAVDDDAFILEIIPKIASKVGYPDVITANCGAKALELIEKSAEAFDCILLDINMLGMDGIDLCARIRSMNAYKDTTIIMLTAMTDMDHLERAFLAGASDYTTKPFDVIEFGDRLQIAHARTMTRRSGGGEAFDRRKQNNEIAASWQGAKLGSVAGVTALIDYASLQNYLNRLTDSAVVGTYAMSIVADWPNTTDEPHQIDALPRIIAAIDDVFKFSRYVMACAGPGLFVVVSNSASLPNAHSIEAAIQAQLTDQLSMTDGNGITVSAGMAVRPGKGRAQRARITFDCAIRLAKDRAVVKKDALRSGGQLS